MILATATASAATLSCVKDAEIQPLRPSDRVTSSQEASALRPVTGSLSPCLAAATTACPVPGPARTFSVADWTVASDPSEVAVGAGDAVGVGVGGIAVGVAVGVGGVGLGTAADVGGIAVGGTDVAVATGAAVGADAVNVAKIFAEIAASVAGASGVGREPAHPAKASPNRGTAISNRKRTFMSRTPSYVLRVSVKSAREAKGCPLTSRVTARISELPHGDP